MATQLLLRNMHSVTAAAAYMVGPLMLLQQQEHQMAAPTAAAKQQQLPMAALTGRTSRTSVRGMTVSWRVSPVSCAAWVWCIRD
jgi:hypothetical protein